jgi:hypothetical protein
MSLIIHASANAISYDELRAVSTPEGTDTHIPVPHHEIVELMRYTLRFFGHEISEEHHAITPDGARHFGMLTLQSYYGDYGDLVGLRNSHDKTFPIGIAFGSRVFVCHNRAFIGDHVIRRKHTVKAKRELPGLLTEIVQPLQSERIRQKEKIAYYRRIPLESSACSASQMWSSSGNGRNMTGVTRLRGGYSMPPHSRLRAR